MSENQISADFMYTEILFTLTMLKICSKFAQDLNESQLHVSCQYMEFR